MGEEAEAGDAAKAEYKATFLLQTVEASDDAAIIAMNDRIVKLGVDGDGASKCGKSFPDFDSDKCCKSGKKATDTKDCGAKGAATESYKAAEGKTTVSLEDYKQMVQKSGALGSSQLLVGSFLAFVATQFFL